MNHSNDIISAAEPVTKAFEELGKASSWL